MTGLGVRHAFILTLCLAAWPVHAVAQDQSQSSGSSDAQSTAKAQTAPAQASSSQPRSYWEPGAGFDLDSHATGYGWFGPTYQRRISDNVGFFAKGSVNYLFYESESAERTTRVSGPGVGTMAGLKFGGSNWFRVGAGPSFKRRNTSFKFSDGSEADGDGEWRTGMTVGADTWVSPASRVNLMGQAQYNTEDNFYWTRLAGRRQISNYGYTGRIANFLGAEAIGMGNEDFTSKQFGGLLEILHVPSSMSIQLRAGWKQQSFDFGDDKSGPYFGIGYWQRLR